MDMQSITRVRETFALVEPVAAQAARSFYNRLFARHADVRLLFGPDIDAQGERLMAMIATGVRLLDRPAELDPALRALGRRHAGYGVRDAHYAAVGDALLDTLANALGDTFDADTRAAWTAFYAAVADAMRAGAATQGAAATPA